MNTIEEKIKTFLKDQGVAVFGIAGPERLKGPPSIDPKYTLRGAKSVISLAMPMNVPAIYDFLGKKSAAPHNMDQAKINQKIHRIAGKLSDYITSLGYQAAAVPSNNTYRRSPDVLATRPTFSHRFAAVVSGVGAFGLSGNVVTKEYGAAIYLCSVVTNAKLKSDPVLPARYFLDGRCNTCKLCDKTCPMKMFLPDEEEYLLINGEIHARGKRPLVDRCNISCFGLHGLSMDKKWSSWGRHWVKQWVENPPGDIYRVTLRAVQARQGAIAGDSTPRYDVIRRMNSILWPEEKVENFLPEYDSLPSSEEERYRLLVKMDENLGVFGLKDPFVLTCGQCALVCGPDFPETKKRYELLTGGGIVVPGEDGRMVRVSSFEEAKALREKYPHKVAPAQRRSDAQRSGSLFIRYYFGFEPLGEMKYLLYLWRTKRALKKAGLAGKEARDNATYNPVWAFGTLFSRRMKKQRLDATKNVAELNA